MNDLISQIDNSKLVLINNRIDKLPTKEDFFSFKVETEEKVLTFFFKESKKILSIFDHASWEFKF